MNRHPKVLHVIKGLGRGGAEMLLVECQRQHSMGLIFHVVYFLPKKDQLVDDLKNQGAKVFCLPASNVLRMLIRLPSLIRLIRSEGYDLLHGHLPWSGIVARLAGKACSVKVVYTEHNNIDHYHRLTKWFNRFTFRLQDFVVSVSHDAEASLRKSMNVTMPIRTILNGVDTDKFDRTRYDSQTLRKELNLPKTDFVVCTVAVFRKQKRLDRWLQMARQLVTIRPDIYFVIIGDGPDGGTLRDLCFELGLTEYVRFTGLLNDPRPWLACSDLYLMSSDFEGLPVALLEAMSMECVPVVNPVGGIVDIVKDRANGLHYDADNVQREASKIIELLDNCSLRKSYACSARADIVANYSIRRMVREIEDVYEYVLHSKTV